MSITIKRGKALTGLGKYANVWWVYKNGNRIGYGNSKLSAEQKARRERSK